MAKTKVKPKKTKSAASKTASKAKDAKKLDKNTTHKVTAKSASKPEPKVKAASKNAELPKKAAKKEKNKKVKAAPTEDLELDDGFEAEDFGQSEIAEYEDELRAVESEDDEPTEGVDLSGEEVVKVSEEIILTDAEGNRYCRARDCDQISAVDAYCRYHYLLFWKKIQIRKKILTDGKLERYVEELTSRYPDKFLEMIRRDLRTEKDFLGAIQELEIDEGSLDNELEEDTQTYIDEVRGMGESSGGGVDEEEF